ncbi:MAG: acetyl-CoA carboxylase biotin carboxyl carrier protein [Planctomycetota bacterium]|jgi:acetyl-CoA carboxylase biotin carboxyl carrier protein
MSQKDEDMQKIEEMIKVMEENNLVELELKHGEDKILLKRFQPQQPAVTAIPMVAQPVTGVSSARNSVELSPSQMTASGAEKKEDLVDITSPIVGTFYATSSPDSEPYVDLDSHVDSQTVICIIEAMKVMNEIKAEKEGTIVEVLVKSGQAVEYGQVLFRVRPD